MSPTPWDLPPRIAAKIAVIPETGCWAWTGARMQQGYGRVKADGKTAMAYRVVYELLCGQIPAEHDMDHLCRHPHCVNPCHVEPVTRAVNRRRQADAALAAPIYPCGHPRNAANNRTTKRAGRLVMQCEACYRHANFDYERRRTAARRAARQQAAA